MIMRHLLKTLLMMFTVCGLCRAQAGDDSRPAASNLPGAGITAVWFEAPGTSHEWQTWRKCLYDFAPRLFRD